MTDHLGYGRWDELREEVRRSWLFRFDWFIKTRSAQELQRRVDALVKLIEKENAELADAEPEASKKRNNKKVRAPRPTTPRAARGPWLSERPPCTRARAALRARPHASMQGGASTSAAKRPKR